MEPREWFTRGLGNPYGTAMPQFITLTFITSGTVAEAERRCPETDFLKGTMEGFQMNATVNLVLGISVCAAIGFAVPLPAANQTPPSSAPEAVIFEANCALTKCQGDFPVSSNRKYAEAKRWGIDRQLRSTDAKIPGSDGTQG